MTMLYLFFSMMINFMFIYFFNPISLGLSLIFQTLLISLMLGSTIKSFWFLYLLLLVYIGGMLILFIYITSIFPNEKFSFNQFNIMNLMMMLLFTLTMILVYNLIFKMNLPFNSFKMNFNSMENYLITNSLKMFNSNSNLLLIFMVNYLFYCMIVVIKITNFIKGPLRKMN